MAKDGSKRQAEDEEVAESTSKRAKIEPVDISWEWENDGHVWTSFSGEHTRTIDEGFKSGVQKMDLFINETKFNIMFERMVQRNSKTYWERRIRANTEGEDGGLSGTSQFEENGKWEMYHHSAQRLIYAAKLYRLDSVNFGEKGQRFCINLVKLEKYNIKTKKSGRIKLLATDDDGDVIIKTEDDIKKDMQRSTGTNKKKAAAKDTSSMQTKSGTGRKNIAYEEGEVVKEISFRGKAPVDDECFMKEKYYVYYEGSTVYDAMLNQTNLKNNNNKFYLMQILKTNTGTGYAVWFRWGRVGNVGQSNLTNCGTDLEKAKQIFCKKFSDKTRNDFGDRHCFEKEEGKYDLLFMDYGSSKDEVDAPVKVKEEKPAVPSKLNSKLQALIGLICSVKEMENAVTEMKYDAKKAPLGKLTKAQIKAGYEALKNIEKCIKNNKLGDPLIKACDAFYTRVPHCFGMQRLPVIRTMQDLKLKIQLLEILDDIEIAMKVMKDGADSKVHPVDQHYASLNCEMKSLDHDSDEFKIINKYTQNTHAKTHNQYKMEVTDVFEIISKQADQFTDIGNRMLLWHGSRLTNFVGILSQGLRIAPPEAPVTGYMFGKGVYFADISSKSANYCYPTRSKNVGFTLLCDVSLGKTHDLLAADYEADKLPAGFNSTKGLGKIAPNSEEFDKLPDGVLVPCGVPTDTGVENPDGYTLNYNEFVVYDTKQIKPRYLVQLKFHFK